MPTPASTRGGYARRARDFPSGLKVELSKSFLAAEPPCLLLRPHDHRPRTARRNRASDADVGCPLARDSWELADLYAPNVQTDISYNLTLRIVRTFRSPSRCQVSFSTSKEKLAPLRSPRSSETFTSLATRVSPVATANAKPLAVFSNRSVPEDVRPRIRFGS